MNINKKKKKKYNRYNGLLVVMTIIFIAIVSRLVYLQVYSFDRFKDLSNNRSVRQVPEAAPRGMILDNTGTVLAKSEQSYMLVFMETEENRKVIFDTLDKVFSLLNETGEVLQDEFPLKVEPSYSLQFKFSDPETIKALDLRFKKDRGFDEVIKRQLYKDQKEELTEDQKAKINEELLKITPEEVFDKLVKDYELYKLIGIKDEEAKKLSGKEIKNRLLEKYKLEDLRRYIVVKDAAKMQSFTGYKPVVISSNIKRESAFTFYQKLDELPGIDVSIQPIRVYPYNSLAASVIGYIGSINASQKESYEERGYDISVDMIGKAGIESAFEDRLKGSKGGTVIKVNSQGRKTEELFRLDPYPGQNIQLTINKDIQYATEKALEDTMAKMRKQGPASDRVDPKGSTRGAAVAIDVNSGKILSMASYPSYDPNLFAVPGRLTQDQIKEYFAPDLEKFGQEYIKRMGLSKTVDQLFPLDSNDPNKKRRTDPNDIYPKPFFNYATQGITPPGSIFKPLTAVAGLDSGVIDKDTIIVDTGIFNKYDDMKDFKGRCDNGVVHGALDVKKAIAVSCNHFFFDVGYKLAKQYNIDKLAEYAWKFGLGSKPGSNVKSTTGVEIEENTYGQTFNFQYNKDLVSATAIYDVVEKFNKGNFGRSGGFKPLDIGKKEDDSDEVKTAKENIKNYVKEIILSAREKSSDFKPNFNDVKKEFKTRITAYVDLLPEEEKVKYDSKQIDTMCYDITAYIIYDVVGNVSGVYNVVNAAIGQGVNQFNLLQITNYMATVANGGTRYRAHLVDKILDPKGNVIEEIKPEVLDTIKMSEINYQTIRDGMELTTAEGTAANAFQGFPIKTAGKTGSATFRDNGGQEEVGRTSYATYVGFAPADKPQIAVAVIIYDGGHGGWAAPVARAIYEEAFKKELASQYPNYKPTFNYKLEQAK